LKKARYRLWAAPHHSSISGYAATFYVSKNLSTSMAYPIWKLWQCYQPSECSDHASPLSICIPEEEKRIDFNVKKINNKVKTLISIILFYWSLSHYPQRSGILFLSLCVVDEEKEKVHGTNICGVRILQSVLNDRH
jgi:hypothetical protein